MAFLDDGYPRIPSRAFTGIFHFPRDLRTAAPAPTVLRQVGIYTWNRTRTWIRGIRTQLLIVLLPVRLIRY